MNDREGGSLTARAHAAGNAAAIMGRLLPTMIAVALLSTSCADPSEVPSARFDGDYVLTATPAQGYETLCAREQLTVRVVGGRLNFMVHPPDAWLGYVDRDGYFHGRSEYGARVFKLSEGISVPGEIGRGEFQPCQFQYRFAPAG